MGWFTGSFPLNTRIGIFALLILASCAKPEGKPFLPVVTKLGSEVRAISREEAATVCKSNYCEENQFYTVNFGRRHRNDPPSPPRPQPIQEPGPAPTTPGSVPAQPPEQFDYSRAILNVSQAWAISEGSSDVTVAVIDSGVDYFHPDLQNNIVVNLAEKNGRAGVDDDGNGFIDDVYGWNFYNERANGYDDNGHGTHCAGVIAAEKNSIGVRGIAPRVKILPVKFLGADGGGDTADAIRAIDYAVARGAKILSNSWGGGGYSQLLDDAVQRAVNRGVIFVAAAGNNGMNIDTNQNYPSNYANVIGVGSSDASDLRSSFSNYGPGNVEIFAPGSAIYSTYPNGLYKTLSGTSMATPQVSGAIALAASVRNGVTRAEVVEDICASAAGRLLEYSQCGRMDVGQFIRRVSTR